MGEIPGIEIQAPARPQHAPQLAQVKHQVFLVHVDEDRDRVGLVEAGVVEQRQAGALQRRDRGIGLAAEAPARMAEHVGRDVDPLPERELGREFEPDARHTAAKFQHAVVVPELERGPHLARAVAAGGA